MRSDKRNKNDLRKIKIKNNYLKYAEGSCLIEMGNTKVVCSASVEDGVPHFLRNSKRGWVTSEYGMLPRSCKSRITREASRGKQSGRTQEIQRMVGRSMRAVTDMKQLGERTIWIDCDVLQGDGGTRAASITGAFIALAGALKNIKKRGIINSVPLNDYVACISVGILKGEIILDLNYQEDSQADVDMNIVMTSAGKFIEIQGAAEGKTFSKKDILEMLNTAGNAINKIIKKQKEILKLKL